MEHSARNRGGLAGARAAVPAAVRHTVRPDTFEEERSEVLASVFDALCHHAPDADEMAACAYLMRHLNARNPSGPA